MSRKRFKQNQNDLVHNHHHDDNLAKKSELKEEASKKLDQTLKNHFNSQSKHGSKK